VDLLIHIQDRGSGLVSVNGLVLMALASQLRLVHEGAA
jgi:hypothetical protein